MVPVDQLTPQQLKRYRAWKRSRLERGSIREVSPTAMRVGKTSLGLWVNTVRLLVSWDPSSGRVHLAPAGRSEGNAGSQREWPAFVSVLARDTSGAAPVCTTLCSHRLSGQSTPPPPSRPQIILDRAAPTLTRALEGGRGTGNVKEGTVIAVAAVAKMYVGDVIEEGAREREAWRVIPRVRP